jgi:cytochrome c biogenesis protein CcmG/thiol:disulfide interchange protein DsbE
MTVQRRVRILAVALLLILVLSSAPPAPAAVLAADARKPAAAFTLEDDSGKPLALSDLQGKVVLLNFWATWCHGCKTELPWFSEFAKTYGKSGLAVVGASTDKDGWKVVRPYLRQKPVHFPVVLAPAELTDSYHLEAMPMTILIDRRGRVAATFTGMVDRAVCEKDLQALLHE